MEINMNDIINNPIQPDEIEWRVQSAKDGKMTIVPYITNRCVMDRFDNAFGSWNWNSEFREIDNGFICRLTVRFNGETIYREDGASKTAIEAEKGGISDAMKRAAVQFGLGRGLYKYPRVVIADGNKYIPNWAYPKLNQLVKWLNDGNTKDYVLLENK
jgi:hypothetical protein